MKIYFMKQTALDFMKSNMPRLYKNYFQFDSPEWITELFDYDPFELFKEVPDFELADLNMLPGEIDLQNCKILFTKLKDVSDSQASDERLWAGICNKTFYSYLRKRLKLAKKHLKKSSDDSMAIISRYFYKSSGRTGMFRNTLARCWWTGRLTYSDKYNNRWELLDALGSEDLISKISDIFYSNTYSSNGLIVEGFCQGLKFFRDRGIHISNREHIRPTAQLLNAIGGSELLDMFSADEVKKIVVENISELINGRNTGLAEDDTENDDSIIDVEDDFSDNAEEVNVDFSDYLDSLTPVVQLDLDSVLGKLKSVEHGCVVRIHKMPDNIYYDLPIPLLGMEMNLLQRQIMNKPIGFSINFGGKTYSIFDIYRNPIH